MQNFIVTLTVLTALNGAPPGEMRSMVQQVEDCGPHCQEERRRAEKARRRAEEERRRHEEHHD